jgi:uncharacterized protein
VFDDTTAQFGSERAQMAINTIALGLMCKAPAEGASKTRLCPPLTGREAAEMSRCFISDVAAVVAAVPPASATHGVAVYAPAGAEAGFDGVLPPGFAMRAQRGHGLGERLLCASEDLLGAGHEGVCLIGADSPTLPIGLLTRAADALRQPGDRLVIAPALDGGYCLIGLKRAHASLFRDVAWSTSQVLAQTLTRAAALGIPVTLLPIWYDVDDLVTLRLLMHEIFGKNTPLAAGDLTGSPADHSRTYLRRLLHGDGASRFGFVNPAKRG